MHTTNYHATLITVSPDCTSAPGQVPAKPGSVAALLYLMLAEGPYRHTSDDLLFGVFAARKGLEDAALDAARAEFFAKPQACLRASPLVKTHGWGLHHDAQGRVALVAPDSPRYAELLADPAVAKRPGMRSRRG